MKKDVRWRPDFPYKKRATAARVNRALDAIEAKYGELTPAHIVKEARPAVHPLHSFFEWDSRRAAQEYRLEQARRLVRAVIYTLDDADETSLRVYIHVVEPGKDKRRKYMGVEEAMASPQYRAQILEQAKREARAFREKYAVLKELATVFKAIDRLSS